ncbi:MAG: hypothetical protein U9P14_02535 [Gemmatimonadota bacterium]|nr:hypothetical protein [Gemmatimonadota bacterium]
MNNSWLKIISLCLLAPALLAALAAGGRDKPELIFSHNLHVGDMGMECELCHAAAQESKTGLDNLFPEKDACLECHEIENCRICHSDTENPRSLGRIEDYSPKFNHALHLKKQIACERCHTGVPASDSSASEHIPAMEPCMGCHDGMEADNSCIVCHEHQRGKLPADHVFPAWKEQHGDEARFDNAASCRVCHAINDCQQCHQGDNLLPRTHRPGFEFNHGFEVRSGRGECAACHEDRSYCIECHRMRQVYPRSHQLGGWALEGDTGGRHAAQGRINIEQCAACHADEPDSGPVCATCH